MKHLLIVGLLFQVNVFVHAQSEAVRSAWTSAKTQCNENHYKEAKTSLLAVYKEMPRPLCCYWLAMAYDIESNLDSAIYYYDQCIKNSQKPQLAALDHLIRAYLRLLKFDKAYELAWQAMLDYPGNKVFIEAFKEVCLWAYFLKHHKLDKNYLTNTVLLKEYNTKTITEQSLIIKNIRDNKGQYLHVGNRQHKGHYEIWKCRFNNSKTALDIKFHLASHDLDHHIELQHKQAQKIFNDTNELLYIRLGALMASTPFSDKQALNLLAAPEEAIRLCLCFEISSANTKKIKKACLSDVSENIKAMCNNLDIFK
jgi:tetratricopeptide (TPR) repeat protein